MCHYPIGALEVVFLDLHRSVYARYAIEHSEVRMALKEFRQHSKESRWVLVQANRQAG